MFASRESKSGFEMQYYIFGLNRGATTRKREARDEERCGEWRSTENVLEERRMKMNSANIGRGGPMGMEKRLSQQRSTKL